MPLCRRHWRHYCARFVATQPLCAYVFCIANNSPFGTVQLQSLLHCSGDQTRLRHQGSIVFRFAILFEIQINCIPKPAILAVWPDKKKGHSVIVCLNRSELVSAPICLDLVSIRANVPDLHRKRAMCWPVTGMARQVSGIVCHITNSLWLSKQATRCFSSLHCPLRLLPLV